MVTELILRLGTVRVMQAAENALHGAWADRRTMTEGALAY